MILIKDGHFKKMWVHGSLRRGDALLVFFFKIAFFPLFVQQRGGRAKRRRGVDRKKRLRPRRGHEKAFHTSDSEILYDFSYELCTVQKNFSLSLKR